MKKLLPISIVIVSIIAIGVGAFYGGMKYDQGKSQTAFRNLGNLTPEERQQRLQQMGANAGAGFRSGNSANSGISTGEIISIDDKSVTVKLRDGGSKIVFFSDSTKITKSAEGSLGDLEVGKTIVVGGKQNSDGSLTAETIQLSPAIPFTR